jgi:ATP-independent RNA helicase DbpA
MPSSVIRQMNSRATFEVRLSGRAASYARNEISRRSHRGDLAKRPPRHLALINAPPFSPFRPFNEATPKENCDQSCHQRTNDGCAAPVDPRQSHVVQATFEALRLSPALISVVHDLGYTQPTPIQIEAIPALLAGRNIIGQSQTGSGKTAAFALPILQGIEVERRELQALVICPTRELTAQVGREIRKLGRDLNGLQVLELVGGQPSGPQRDSLERGPHIAIGTPGRLLDHLERGFMKPDSIKTVVLDEADRMLDMGFGEDVRKIINHLPQDRQTALFSATFPSSIEAMSKAIQQDALRITIETADEDRADIRQLKLCYGNHDKLLKLCWALQAHPHGSALVFCNQKSTVREITKELCRGGISVDRFDGDLEQFDRDQVLARFRNHSVRVLIATDVAGRGLDVEGLDLVINYDLPEQAEIYVHRIGRTGRAGATGIAISMVQNATDPAIVEIEKFTGKTIEILDSSASKGLKSSDLMKELAKSPRMETILISGGRKDKVRKGDILGALTGDAGGLSSKEIGKIEIQEKLSYVAVSQRVIAGAVSCLNAGRIKGKRFRASHVGR